MQNVGEGENTVNQHHILCPRCFLPSKLHKSVILRGSVAKCLTRTPEVLGSSCNGPSVFRGSVLGQDTSEPKPSSVETQERHEKCKCCRDVTKIPLKNTIQSRHKSSFPLHLIVICKCSDFGPV